MEISIKEKQITYSIVDDNSPDNTAKQVKDLATKFDNIYLLERNSKKNPAIIFGSYALDKGYEYLIQMDADFSHTVEDLINMIEHSSNADLVIVDTLWVEKQLVGKNLGTFKNCKFLFKVFMWL